MNQLTIARLKVVRKLLTRRTVSSTGCQLLDELYFVRIVFWTNRPIGRIVPLDELSLDQYSLDEFSIGRIILWTNCPITQ
jgi:hypothetical protein